MVLRDSLADWLFSVILLLKLSSAKHVLTLLVLLLSGGSFSRTESWCSWGGFITVFCIQWNWGGDENQLLLASILQCSVSASRWISGCALFHWDFRGTLGEGWEKRCIMETAMWRRTGMWMFLPSVVQKCAWQYFKSSWVLFLFFMFHLLSSWIHSTVSPESEGGTASAQSSVWTRCATKPEPSAAGFFWILPFRKSALLEAASFLVCGMMRLGYDETEQFHELILKRKVRN